MSVENGENSATSNAQGVLRFLPFFLVPVALIAIVSLMNGCEQNLVADKPDATQSDSGDATAGDVDPAQTTEPNAATEEDATPAPQKIATPVANQELEVINFDYLNIGMQKDARFRPIMLDYDDSRIKRLLGKRINVGGYMNPTDTQDGVEEFVLLKNLECKFGPGGQADHLVRVLMQDGKTTSYTDAVIYVEGVLELNPFPEQGPTWSIYDLKATKVSTRPPPRRR